MKKSGRFRAWICAVCVVTAAAASVADEPNWEFPHDGWVGGVAFDAKSSRLATASADKTARLFALRDGRELGKFEGHGDIVASVALSPDGRTLATGSFDRDARLWDVDSKRTHHRLSGHRGAVMCTAFSPDGKLLATGGIDATIKLWDAKTGRLRASLVGHQSWVNAVAFDADGALLASGSSDGTIRLWNVADAREKSSIRATKAEVRSVAISPDGRWLAAGIRYGQVQVWELPALAPRWQIDGHKSDVWSVAFDPSGKTLFTANGDWNEPGEIKAWHTENGRHLRTIGHSGEVLSVAVSPNGRYLAAGGADKFAAVWDLAAQSQPPDKWREPMRRVHARFKGTGGTFAQFGDSITVSLAYWAPLAHEPKGLSRTAARALARVKNHMQPECWREWRGGKYGSEGRMTIRWAHDNIAKWLADHNPEVALIMFGTNDIGQVPLEEYEKKLGDVVDRCLANGTVTIISTIPPRSGHLDESQKFAEAARKIAMAKSVPLIGYHAEILRLRPDDWDGSLPKFKGQYEDVYDVPTLISGDGVHPSNPESYSDYSRRSLRTNGFVLRNYLTLLMYANVIENVLAAD
jgi:lysophospholipase L1-like esterase